MTDTTDDPLDPDELDPDEDRLRSLGGGRYVVTAGDGATDPADPTDGDPAPTLDGVPGAYAVAIRARTGTDEAATRVASDDVAASFEALVRWYAGQVAPDHPAEEAVATLLANADLALDVRVDRTG